MVSQPTWSRAGVPRPDRGRNRVECQPGLHAAGVLLAGSSLRLRRRILGHVCDYRRGTVRHEPPLAWPNYIDSVEFYEQLGQKKEFQTELRKTILEQRGDVAAEQAEIDVGLKKGRQKTGYADLVITDPTNNLEVYSLKVRNVTAQTVKLGDDNQVRRWIRENLSQDVKDAIDQYGGKVQFRRPYRSTAEGRAGTSKSGPHPLYEQKVFVNRVILIWKGTGDLVPERFREYILSTGNELGAKYRATISCEVQLQP